jgi:hypothetical protein
MTDDPARDAQDPQAPQDRRPVGPGNRRVRPITIALVVGALILIIYGIVATGVLDIMR